MKYAPQIITAIVAMNVSMMISPFISVHQHNDVIAESARLGVEDLDK